MERFRVQLLALDGSWDPEEALASVFGIGVEQARAVVANLPATVKRNVTREVAEKYREALVSIGARVEIVSMGEQSILPRPHGMTSLPPVAGHRSERSFPAPPQEPPVSTPSAEAQNAPTPSARPAFSRAGIVSHPPAAQAAAAVAVGSAVGAGAVGAGAADRRWHCQPCERYFQEPELREMPVGASGQSMKLCPSCNGVVVEQKHEIRRDFHADLFGAFTYPFQKDGAPVLVGVALVTVLLSYVWIIGPILSLGIIYAYFFAVMRHSTNGHNDLPAGGDFTSFEDFLAPIFRYVMAVLVSFAPAVAIFMWLPSTTPLFFVALGLAVFAGLVYIPASLMLTSLHSGCLGPFNVPGAIQLIMRLPVPYVTTTAVVGALMLIGMGMSGVSAFAVDMLPIPFVSGVFVDILELYCPIVTARMLGLFILHFKPELGLT